jgi:hypothetical protein
MRDKRIAEILKKQIKEGDKLKIETLKNEILNNKYIEKSLYDVCNIINCDNYEYLIDGYLGILRGQRKNTLGINKTSFDTALGRDFKSCIDAHQQKNGGRVEGVEFPFDAPIQEEEVIAFDCKAEGIKETEGKLHYELSWEFIEEMAKRMANNKSGKYPLYNWKKSINVQELKDAINRHHIEVMKGNYQDGEEALGHIVSYACNSMMLWEQLNKNK